MIVCSWMTEDETRVKAYRNVSVIDDLKRNGSEYCTFIYFFKGFCICSNIIRKQLILYQLRDLGIVKYE